MTLDFTTQLHSFVEGLNLSMPALVGSLEGEDTISLYPLPGGSVIRKFYNKIEDKRLNYEFGIKTKRQVEAMEILDTIGHALADVEDIPSSNGSYDFREIQVSSEPFLVNADTEGFFYYQLTISAELTTYV